MRRNRMRASCHESPFFICHRLSSLSFQYNQSGASADEDRSGRIFRKGLFELGSWPSGYLLVTDLLRWFPAVSRHSHFTFGNLLGGQVTMPCSSRQLASTTCLATPVVPSGTHRAGGRVLHPPAAALEQSSRSNCRHAGSRRLPLNPTMSTSSPTPTRLRSPRACAAAGWTRTRWTQRRCSWARKF